MDDILLEFWQNTWSAWRAGILSSINSKLAQVAAGEYEDFINKSTSFKNPLISTFFTNNPPLPGEFLINYEEFENRLLMVMTSKRLWVYEKNTDKYEDLNLSDITQIKSSSRWNSHNITVRFKDNQEQKFKNLGWIRSDHTFARAIQLANNNDQQREPAAEMQPASINSIQSSVTSIGDKALASIDIPPKSLDDREESTTTTTTERKDQEENLQEKSSSHKLGYGLGPIGYLFVGIFLFTVITRLNTSVTKTNYDMIRDGMSFSQIEEVLGTISNNSPETRSTFTGQIYWDYHPLILLLDIIGDTRITVEFIDGYAENKHFELREGKPIGINFEGLF